MSPSLYDYSVFCIFSRVWTTLQPLFFACMSEDASLHCSCFRSSVHPGLWGVHCVASVAWKLPATRSQLISSYLWCSVSLFVRFIICLGLSYDAKRARRKCLRSSFPSPRDRKHKRQTANTFLHYFTELRQSRKAYVHVVIISAPHMSLLSKGMFKLHSP
jgi:hypothetical protein